MAKAKKPGNRNKQRRYYKFKLTLEDYSNVFFDIGAYSISQMKLLAHKGRREIGITVFKSENWFTASRPVGSPEKGAFIMHDGKILKIS